jgi:hypothetical protein
MLIAFTQDMCVCVCVWACVPLFLFYVHVSIKLLNSIQEAIKSWLKLGNACYHSVQNVLSSSLLYTHLNIRGKRCRSWLRHCTTNPKVIGIFHWHSSYGRTMALELTQPLTEVSTRNISWGWRRPVRRADNLTTFMRRLSRNLGASSYWNPQGLSRPVMGLLYLLHLNISIYVGL